MATPQPGQSFGNLGIGSAMVEVPESGIYQSEDGSVSKRYRAGTRIPRQEAQLLGIVPIPEAAPEVAPLTDAELGEQYARCLAAAGYALTPAKPPRDDQPEAKAEPEPANKREPVPRNKAETPPRTKAD